MTTTIDSSPGHAGQEEPPVHAPGDPAPASPSSPGRAGFGRRVIRGRPEDPAWVRPALFGLLVVTAVLYLWGLSKSGWANSFYSAAVQAGSVSWKAFFFGASDAGNAITVDKPPMSLWFMELSVRAFGLSSFAILLPQALMGVASVGVLYAAVRRHFSGVAGLLAGAVLALTPVAVLMFRFNNPDALLVLLMTGAAYAIVRGIESGRTRWVVLTGVLIGFGFLTKQLQVLLVVPGLGLAYLVAAPKSLGRRILDLVWGVVAIVVAAGWWLVAVSLTPAAMRPFIGGSQHNSIWELTFGYNGFGRLTGNETGSVGGGGNATGGGNWGSTGLTRLFGSDMGGQISWLLPAALILLVAGLYLTWRAPRTDPVRASLIVWGGWLLVTGLTFSEMQGIIHPYYTVALAPAVGALVGIGGWLVWKHRAPWSMPLLAGTVLVTALWSFTLLNRSSDFHPGLKYAVLVAGIVVAAALALSGLLARRLVAAVGVAAVVVGLAGPAAYALNTASTGHTGSIVSAGPSTGGGFGGGGFPRAGGRGFGGNGGGFGAPGQAPGGTGPTQNGTTSNGTGTTNGTGQPSFGGGGFGGGGRGGGMGGLLTGTTPSAALTQALKANASTYTWVAATIGSNNASGYQLASQEAVMPIGGFNGTDPSPTLAQFEADVKAGKIHYFIPASGLGGRTSSGGSDVASQIEQWVESNYTASTIGGTTVYDLSS